ncbi:hypothetical protein [Roseiconus lacunae]|uniref:Uncharacterized protein n=1 Tax=Roseiconus lacunae TaxID=2605694 RepID=A0ABT7PH38_9BACT|nr:hypothetical protein [Roseiconus lacunae]MDM4015511.1 hypothetical protein [Roseiconus lacunae]
MVVTVIAVWVMQVTVDKIVNVVAVRDGFMPTAGTVNVTGIMTAALMCRGATVGVGVTNFDAMLYNGAVVIDVMQVTIVQIVNMITMLDAGVFAIGAVLVVVMIVCLTH